MISDWLAVGAFGAAGAPGGGADLWSRTMSATRAATMAPAMPILTLVFIPLSSLA
jgi:hypothetical protein